MRFCSFTSSDKVQRIFPASSPLYPLVVPTFDTVRRSLSGLCISAIWIDAVLDPSRAGFRPSYDELVGEGSATMMPFIGSWMSSGPDCGDQGNQVLFLDTMDRSIIRYAEDIGILGDYTFVSNLADIKRTVIDSGRKLYSIDDIGEEFDPHSAISSKLAGWLNSKDDLASISKHSPPEVIKDMHEVTLDDFLAIKREGHRVFLKTCNTETAGFGVKICNNDTEFLKILDELRDNQLRFDLNRTLVIQRELLGTNRSFNIFIDPGKPDEIQVVALTNQLVEADGKTYKGSVNFPINAQTLERVGPVIIDLVERTRARHPEAFGFLMCDFFESPDGEMVVYDPGIRPTGNTATAMVSLLAKKLTDQYLYVSNFQVDTGVPGFSFDDLIARTGGLTRPESLIKTGTGLFPWGWNRIKGKGIMIGVAKNQEGFDVLVERTKKALSE